MGNKLNHLSENEILSLIEKYYDGARVKLLLDEYKIDLHPGQLVKSFPLKKSSNLCQYCRGVLMVRYLSRSYSKKEGTPTCMSCGHINKIFCQCKNCLHMEQIRINKETNKNQILLDSILSFNESGKINFDSLTIDDKVYLGALLREGLSDDFYFINPFKEFINPLAPTREFEHQIIDQLHEKKIIRIHRDSNIDHFHNIDMVQEKFNFSIEKVKWRLNVHKRGLNEKQLIELLINPPNENNLNIFLDLWKKISIYESLEYLQNTIYKVFRTKYTSGEKTISILTELVENYSVSQVYTIIYRSTNNVLRIKTERGIHISHAINTIISNAHSFSERAINNKWEIQKYSRSKECPESALSKFLFDRILKIGQDGFNIKPTLQ